MGWLSKIKQVIHQFGRHKEEREASLVDSEGYLIESGSLASYEKVAGLPWHSVKREEQDVQKEYFELLYAESKQKFVQANRKFQEGEFLTFLGKVVVQANYDLTQGRLEPEIISLSTYEEECLEEEFISGIYLQRWTSEQVKVAWDNYGGVYPSNGSIELVKYTDTLKAEEKRVGLGSPLAYSS